MKDHSAYDRVLKDLFQMDRTSLLVQWTGGVPVKEFAKVEFQRIMERRADLVALLDDISLQLQIVQQEIGGVGVVSVDSANFSSGQ